MSSFIQSEYPLRGGAQCFGCGRANKHGLHLKTAYDASTRTGEGRFTPRPEHMAQPGVVYGGILACAVDCNAVGTAIAARKADTGGSLVPHVTGQLNVRYRRPTPTGEELRIVSRVTAVRGKKTELSVEVVARGEVTVTAEVVAVAVKASL